MCHIYSAQLSAGDLPLLPRRKGLGMPLSPGCLLLLLLTSPLHSPWAPSLWGCNSKMQPAVKSMLFPASHRGFCLSCVTPVHPHWAPAQLCRNPSTHSPACWQPWYINQNQFSAPLYPSGELKSPLSDKHHQSQVSRGGLLSSSTALQGHTDKIALSLPWLTASVQELWGEKTLYVTMTQTTQLCEIVHHQRNSSPPNS